MCLVVLDELDGANVFDHREAELRLHAQAERGSVIDRSGWPFIS